MTGLTALSFHFRDEMYVRIVTKISSLGRHICSLTKRNPKTVGIAVGFTVSPFIHLFLSSRYKRKAIKPIDDVIRLGSKPPVYIHSTLHTDRLDLVKEIRDAFVGPQKEKGFGVIIGPTGTGKTSVIRDVCNKNPTSGILYHELLPGPRWAVDAVETFKIPVNPDGLIGLILSYLSSQYAHYYTLPNDGEGFTALKFVINLLVKRGAEYRKANGHPPCLFLDGADLLAKEDKEGFVKLVNLAKVECDSLRIVFVSSEGHVMPLIRSTSSSSRALTIKEILDISDAQALQYLVKLGMPESLAKQVVLLTGGRMIFLQQAYRTYQENTWKGHPEKDQLQSIEKVLVGKYVAYPMICLTSSHIRGFELAKYIVSKNGIVDCNALKRDLFDKDKNSMYSLIDELVNVNVLRYTENSTTVTWHNKMVERAVEEWISEDVDG